MSKIWGSLSRFDAFQIPSHWVVRRTAAINALNIKLILSFEHLTFSVVYHRWY